MQVKGWRFNGGMPALTSRRSKDPAMLARLVRVGTIAIRSGNPADIDPWAWSCGFYPGSHPREYTSGTAAAFDQARAAFEAAWRVFLSKRTEADFQEWREEICHVASRRTVAVAAADQHHAVHLWRVVRQPPAR